MGSGENRDGEKGDRRKRGRVEIWVGVRDGEDWVQELGEENKTIWPNQVWSGW